MKRSTALLAVLVVTAAPAAEAQRAARSSPVSDATAVRSEMAAVLLQSKRYYEAAREYRALLALAPGNFAARLGLAQALAWGKQPRAAEIELRILQRQRPGNHEVEDLLRSVRASFEPRSTEAAVWVAERPGYVPYRLALARALVREGRAGAALPHYNLIITQDRSTPVALEAVNAHVAADRFDRATQLLRALRERVPGDTAVRHLMASTLAGARQYDAALAAYDSLIAWFPRSELLLERGQVQLARRDLAAAEADAIASLNAQRNVGAYLLLGDLRRWRGDFKQAGLAYEYARISRPNDPAVAVAAAQLRRDERPIIAFVPSGHAGESWEIASSSLSDNEGITYATANARRRIDLHSGTVGTIDVDVRRLAGPAISGPDIGITGFGLGFGVRRELVYGRFLGRLSGRGGIVQHTAASMISAAVEAAGWIGPWGISIEQSLDPAYPTLLTTGAIRPPTGNNKPMSESSTSIGLGGPLGHADVALRAERSDISDNNRRSSVQALMRYTLDANVSALLSANGIWFAERSPLYWDPKSYRAAAAGLELARRRSRGFSFASRVLAGVAHSEEQLISDDEPFDQNETSLHIGGGGDVSYRTATHELGAAVSYGSGRTGAYRVFEANVFVRLLR